VATLEVASRAPAFGLTMAPRSPKALRDVQTHVLRGSATSGPVRQTASTFLRIAAEVATAGANCETPIADANIDRPPFGFDGGLDGDQILLAKLRKNLLGTRAGVFRRRRPQQIPTRPLGQIP
jgi:hypothetical protein